MKHYYELYCERGQVFDSDGNNFSLFVETNKGLRTYGKLNNPRVLKTQRKLEKLLKNKLDNYHIVGIKKYEDKEELLFCGDLEEKDIIKLEL